MRVYTIPVPINGANSTSFSNELEHTTNKKIVSCKKSVIH